MVTMTTIPTVSSSSTMANIIMTSWNDTGLWGGGVKVVTMITLDEVTMVTLDESIEKEEREVGVAVEGVSLVTVTRTNLLTLEAWHI